MVTEVIDYYKNNGSPVYMCMLDASKAFDRVNFLTLFKTLYSRGVCPFYLRLLMKIYEEQQMRIRWNNSVSEYFTISNSVKQGGVLSLVLFSIYLDQLIAQLRHLGMGCYMNGLFTGVFIYADDITLLAPLRERMVPMLENCGSFALTHDILFNASKIKYMIFNRCESVYMAPLYFKNMPINCVHECDLLGIPLSSRRTTNNVIENEVMKFNMKSNEVISDFKLWPYYIKSKLFTTFCTDAYGCQLWNFESREVHNLYVARRKVVRKLWHLPYITHCNLLHTINNPLPIQI